MLEVEFMPRILAGFDAFAKLNTDGIHKPFGIQFWFLVCFGSSLVQNKHHNSRETLMMIKIPLSNSVGQQLR